MAAHHASDLARALRAQHGAATREDAWSLLVSAARQGQTASSVHVAIASRAQPRMEAEDAAGAPVPLRFAAERVAEYLRGASADLSTAHADARPRNGALFAAARDYADVLLDRAARVA